MSIEDFLESTEGKTISVVANFDRAELDFEEPQINENDEIPILPLRNMMLFPGTLLPVTISRESAQKLLSEAVKTKQIIGVFGQKEEDEERPSEKELYRTGVVGKVLKIIKLPDGQQTAFLHGFSRVRLLEAHEGKNYMLGHVEAFPEIMPEGGDKQFKATIEACKDVADKFIARGDGMHIESSFTINDVASSVFFVNFLCASLPLQNSEHIMLLEQTYLAERATKLLTLLNREFQFAKLKANIQMQTHAQLSQQQREYFLKKEIENIKGELGDSDEEDVEKFRKRAASKKWDEETKKHFEKELEKLSHMNSQGGDYSTQYEYLDTLLSLPWNEYSKDNINITNAEKVLNKDHYGLESVKERILEHLAVVKMRGDMKSPILCLYGPPGVGKTSLGKSIARAMKREYVRVSLGGVHDEAEIRGHRRTYVGAMPGRIIKGIMEAKTSNPVFILDEIDKVGQDAMHGDPSSALLEVLDPEQNKAFHDNYIDYDYDISKVMFIATANNLSTIPRPLLDRMEIIEVSGYITEEKLEIAKRHLIPKEKENTGLNDKKLNFNKAAIEKIIEQYTRESGVRQLEKQVNKALRKMAFKKAESGVLPYEETTPTEIEDLLGKPPFYRDIYQGNDYAGVVTGLAWTSVGGEILFIETSLSKGKAGKLTLTGNLGDVMKESAVIALEYVKAHVDVLGIDYRIFDHWNIHIHVPEGATPKDGPSAGITIATSIASALTQRKVRKNTAMTGEITLRGKVLPVGGIKEKILAAKRAGITDIVMCQENEKDINEIPEMYLKGVTFHYVENIKDVWNFALTDELVEHPTTFDIPEEKDEKK